jgi:hypothetical protein
MKFSKFSLVLAGIFVIVLMLNTISALGISPGRTTLDFKPGLAKTVTVTVINTENKNMDVVLYVQGELKNSVTLLKDGLSFSANEKEKSFFYELKLPEEMDRPGLHTAEIVALEVPEGANAENAIIGATVAVVSQLYVNVPYPGKYIDYDLDIVEKGGKVSFYIPVTNRGKQDISKLEGSIKIYSGEKLVDELSLDSVPLASEKRTELIAEWLNAEPGNYKADLTMNYDGEKKTTEKEFKVGNVKLEIISITVEDFLLGQIAKFNILVESKWATEIRDVSVRMLVYGEQGETIADFATQDYDVPAFDRVNMNSYWDTKDVKKGIYDGKIILNYEGEKQERNVRVQVTENSIEILGLTGHVVAEGSGKLNLVNLLLIIVGILIVANIIWFVVVKKLKKKSN